MKDSDRISILKLAKPRFKKIDPSLPVGTYEVEEDKIIAELCEERGFTLSEFYASKITKSINVHSISSVITNSSEIIYIVDDGKTKHEIMKILEPYIKLDREEGNWSGSGGCVDCYHDDPNDYDDPNDARSELLIDVDWSMTNTIDAIDSLFGYKPDF